MNLKIGKYEISILDCGVFKLDGGAMFGVIPKTIWNKTNPSDELNRITLGLRPILIKGCGRTILVDSGIGDKFAPKYSQMYCVENAGKSIEEALFSLGVGPDDISDIIVTHLHFDHCGGFTKYNDGGVSELIFKNADIYVQKIHHAAAVSPTERDRASFIKENTEPILNSPRLKAIDGNIELFEGISVRVFNGHTPGMQAIWIESEGASGCYLSDLAPTSSHVPIPYIMGYDLQPLVIIDEKKRTFDEMAAKGTYAIFEHDPDMFVAKIQKGDKGFSYQRA